MKHTHHLALPSGTTWLLAPSAVPQVESILRTARVAPERLLRMAAQPKTETRPRTGGTGVAVLGLFGVLEHTQSFVGWIMGGDRVG